jgi:hypothetical protein
MMLINIGRFLCLAYTVISYAPTQDATTHHHQRSSQQPAQPAGASQQERQIQIAVNSLRLLK